jgi:hypothetical protein
MTEIINAEDIVPSCIICLDNIIDNEYCCFVTIKECGHSDTCDGCAFHYFVNDMGCPVCTQKITNIGIKIEVL